MTDQESSSNNSIEEVEMGLKEGTSMEEEQQNSTDDSVIPPELLELQEVDMNNAMMDPLEWTTRKLISIPKVYYWETIENDEIIVDPQQLPMKLKVWHRSVAAMGAVVYFTDRLGKSFANVLGLTTSQFDFVTSTMTEADWEYSRRTVAERRRIREQEEQGGGDQTTSATS